LNQGGSLGGPGGGDATEGEPRLCPVAEEEFACAA
jgi:hypothetical protein